MSTAIARRFVCLAALLLLLGLVTSAFAQTPFFAAGNLVVSVEGCGVEGGTCTDIQNGTGTGGGYGDNQGAPLTLFQFSPTGTSSVSFVNSLALPQTGSGANFPVSGEYGSSSEGTINLAGTSQYLAIMGYGVNAASFNANPTLYGIPGGELGQSGSLTGQSYTPVPRITALIDPYGNVNSSTAIFNIFNANNPRSTYTADGTHIYVSGQGTSGDATGGVFYTTLGSGSATTIVGDDAGSTSSQDTRDVQIYNNTLYVSMDSKSGSYNRSYIGTLGDPPATSVFTCTGVGAGCPSGAPTVGPALMPGFGNTGGTGKETLTTGTNGNGNNLNNTSGTDKINLSPENFYFASSTVLYVADSGSPKNDSDGDDNSSGTGNIGDGGLQKWIFSDGSWSLAYTLYRGLNLVNNGGSSGTTGLIGLAGTVSGSNVYLYATNYTISDLDPTYLYGITDTLSFTTASQAASESFTELAPAPADSNFKGVSFVPTLPAGSATITTSPSGLTVTSAGTGCAPSTFTTPVTPIWTPGSSCALSVVTPQAASGVQYVFAQWGDGTTSTTDDVTAPATSAVYSAAFTAQPSAIYSPVNGSNLGGTSVTFQWGGFLGANAFWLDIGSTQGGNNYYSSGSLSNSTFSLNVSGLPSNGSTVYATWYYLLNGSWVANNYSYTALGASGSKGVITVPTPGSTLSGSSVTFDWTAGSGATGYWIDIGSSAGGNNYYSSGNLGNVLTTTVYGLPTNGSAVYVTLYSLVGGVWLSNAYSYTAFNLAAAAGVLTTPAPGSTLTSGTVTFDWTAGSGASAYWMDIGNSAGGNNYYSSGNLGNVLTTTVSGLPTDGSMLYVTLYSLIGGVWSGNAYTYTALNATSGLATMQSPTPGTTISGSTATFTWSGDSNATAYWVDIGTSAGGNNIYSSGSLGTALTTTVYSLPANGTTIYVSLYSYVGGQWVNNPVTYISGP